MRLRMILLTLILGVAAIGFAQSGAGDAAKKVVLGKLGQTVSSTAIYASPTTRSRIYYRVKPYEYLVIKASRTDEWLQVLLQNGLWGYVPTNKVARLPYDAVADSTPRATASAPTRDPGNMNSRAAMAQYSLQFTGTPYKWGGNDPNRGIDCSGFVKFLYGKIGMSLPRTAAEQALVGQPITRLEDLQPGDRLYFWDKKRGKIGHTGIYLGRGYFQHSSGKGVGADPLGTQKWLSKLVAARR